MMDNYRNQTPTVSSSNITPIMKSSQISNTQNNSSQAKLSSSQQQKPSELQSQLSRQTATNQTPLTIVSAYHNSLNQQHLATQQVDSAFEEYLKVQEELAARGEIEEAIKNLQDGLNERLNLYPARDTGVWLISKLISEIGIRLAVRCLNNDKAEKANQFLKLARKHTEPLPNSDWNENPDWMLTRKNVFKNLALFYQRKEDWSKAFDCFKVALKLEKDLKENYSNTSLTCAVILSKLNRYAESIEYAQNCMNQIETQMNIDRKKPLAEYKFFGSDQNKASDYDKVMTSYAISLHLLGNNLANLKYIKEAKVFLSKASYVTINMLNKPKQDLQLAITNDLNNLQKNYKTQLNSNKKQVMDDIEQSLLTIKTNLANSSYSIMADQQEHKALIGTISNGPPTKMIKKTDLKGSKGKKDIDDEQDLIEDEDDDKKVMNFVQRFAEEKKKKENEALDEYHKRIAQDYDEKQKEFIERQQKTKFTKEGKLANQSKFDASGQFNKADGSKAVAPSQQTLQMIKDRQRASRSAGPKGVNKSMTDDEGKSSRVKKSQVNPAAEGAKLDRKGVKYSSDKGNKNFFTKRRQNIERVNERLGFAPGQVFDGDDDEMTEWTGGQTNQEEIKKFDNLQLPPIKGYKIDDLGLNAAGERALSKYDGYQSDHSQKSKLINAQDPSTKRLLQSIETKYRKNLPSSLKENQDDKNDDSFDDFERAQNDLDDLKSSQVINPFKTINGEIIDMPIYQPPENAKNSIKVSRDWRKDVNASSSDDELPDPKKVMEIVRKMNGVNDSTDAQQKLSLVDGDQTRYEDNNSNVVETSKQNASDIQDQRRKSQRVTIFNKPPKAIGGPPKRNENSTSQLLTVGNAARNISGVTPKGSPRHSQTTNQNNERSNSILQLPLPNSQNDSGRSPNLRGSRSKPGQSKTQPSQQKKQGQANKQQQYVPPGQRQRNRPRQENPWGGDDSDEKRQKRIASQERLRELSQPKPKKYVLVKEDDEEEEEDEQEQKAKNIITKVEKGKGINFSDYVDRDIPYIKNNTVAVGGGGSKTAKTFDTKFNNKSGLFSKIGDKQKQEQEGKTGTAGGDVKYIKDKKVNRGSKTSKNAKKSPSKGGTDAMNSDEEDGPEYLKRAAAEGAQGGFSKFLKGKQLIKKNTMKKKSTLRLNNGQSTYGMTLSNGGNLTLNELRMLENAAAQQIQKMVRGYFLRKWYLNYQIRRRLGIPFSGLEFTENAFLRYFQRPNQRLHDMAMVTPQIIEVINEQGKNRNMLHKTYKHTQNKQKKNKNVLFGDKDIDELEGGEMDHLSGEEGNKVKQASPVRRIPKGATPQQLLDNLQKDFIAKGLDAYTQFKKYGGGIDHDDKGQVIQHQDKQTLAKDDQEVENYDLKVPKWKDYNQNAQGFLDVKEIEEYLKKIGKSKSSKKADDQLALINEGAQQQDAFGKPVQKQNFISSMAAFASMHGAFKRPDETQNPNKQIQSKKYYEDGDEDDIQALLKKRRQIDEDEDFFPIEKYQEFSREVIVFYKRIGDMMVKWTVQVGAAFKKDKKFFIPVKLLGEPLKSRNTIVVYMMNLEMLKISKDIDKNFEFETVWPFILYLFNNWVRHQVKMMGLIDQRPDLKNVFVHSENNMYEVQDFDQNLKEVKEEYQDLLNFSSEIEYDDRFDYEKYRLENNPDHLIDRKLNQASRLRPIEQLKVNKDQLFNSYKQKINMYEQLMQKIDNDKDIVQIDDHGKPIKRVRIKTDELYEPVFTRKINPFEFFLKMHFVSLPRQDIGQYKLMQNLQALNYSEKMKKSGLIEDNIAIMNEERRKRRGLPPLQIIDYNCIDRAALKLKIIVECLFLRRQMNGWCLVPRDVKESLLAKEWLIRRQKNVQIACKAEQLSSDLLKMFGFNIQYPKQFNERAIQIQQSVQKVKDFKNKRQIQVEDYNTIKSSNEIGEFNDTNTYNDIDKELLGSKEGLINTARGMNPLNTIGLRSVATKSGIFNIQENQDMKINDEDNQQYQLQIQEKEDMIGKLMDQQKTKQEVEDFIWEQELLEQGVIKIETNYYLLTLIFRKITSNYENMRMLIDERIKRFSGDDSDEERANQLERMKARPCEFVSHHPHVLQYDQEQHHDIKEMEKIDIEQEKFTKKKTNYKSYAEIKVCSKISTTNWDDSFNLNWESLEGFFSKFNFKWSAKEFMTRRRFNQRERFTFYNFFAECLFIYDCRVQVDMDRLDMRQYKFEKIYLNLDNIKKKKQENRMIFYYDDFLEKEFDPSFYDYPIFPFYEDPRLVNEGIVQDKENVYYGYEPIYEDKVGQAITIQIVEGNRKPELLIDENTREYINDPNNMFNLTLSKFPQSDGIYLGQVQIAGKDGYKNTFNLRIDYYVMGYTPILQIKAFNTIYHDIYDLKVTHQKTIKDIIRICNQSSMKMVVNQLQSMIAVNKKLNGSYLKLNFNVRKDKNINLGQNYINMLICNENLMRTMQKDNYRQFQGIVYFDNLGGRMLVTVTEFNLDVEQIQAKDADSQVLHGNKHMVLEDATNNFRTGVQVLKRFQKIRIWKINIFNIFNSRNYEAVISYEDLVNYYQSDIFKFYQDHPNMIKPNLVLLLQDYIRNLFVFRSKVGYQLYWKLPHFARPLDESGQVQPIQSDQVYKLKLLEVYQTLQKRIDEQNKDEDNNALPFSLDQMKAKKHHREPPTLSLRNKLIIEKDLPIFQSNDLRTLKLTSSNHEIIIQMPKVFKSLVPIQYCIITVVLYPTMECWMWQIYFIKTQRTFTVTFYPSDLFNMDHEILNYSGLNDAKNPAVGLWTELIKRTDLQQNPSGDVILICESFKEPLREVLFQDHVFNENAMDIFFMEVTLKSYNNYVTDVRYSFYPLDTENDELNEYTIGIRAYSLTRNIWIKDYQPLTEIVRILKKEKYITNQVKLIYYSMLKDAATLLAHKIVFSDEAKTTEIRRKKLTYDIRQILNNKDQFQKLQEEVRDQPSPDKKKREDKKSRRQEPLHKNPNKLDDTADIIKKDRGLRPEWKNQIELNKIIYQGVVSQNPVQVCTVIYNDVKDVFIYRLYRISDCTTYEKRISSGEIQKTCAPTYQMMLRNKMQSQLGQRICDFYKTNMIVASLMNYYNLKK